MTLTRIQSHPPASAGNRTPQILVVEDEAIVALDFQLRLKALGYQVAEVVHDGAAALQAAISVRPDLILMDINLSDGRSGIETAATIRQQLDVPVVYVTANSDHDTVQRAAQTGPAGYILKPFEDHELEAAIRTALTKHELDQRFQQEGRWFG
jgi:two-component system, cell cycle sensor histidine kinase and response regulator CckA